MAEKVGAECEGIELDLFFCRIEICRRKITITSHTARQIINQRKIGMPDYTLLGIG